MRNFTFLICPWQGTVYLIRYEFFYTGMQLECVIFITFFGGFNIQHIFHEHGQAKFPKIQKYYVSQHIQNQSKIIKMDENRH